MGVQKQASHKVSLLSYNLYCLPWLACMMRPSTCPNSYDRVKAFLKHIPQYDIIGLQEVWSPRYQQVESFAKHHGLHVVGSSQASVKSMAGLRVFGGGLMIISKYPIETTRELVFDKGVASDGFVTKGILYAKIKINSSYVHVFNTHMQASYGYEFKEHDPYALIRLKQIQKIATFMSTLALDDDHPIIVMGDLNVNAIRHPEHGGESREYLEMLEMLGNKGLFNVIDLHKEFSQGQHPVTNSGRGVLGKKKSFGGQRLDFVFEIRRNRTRRDRIFHKFPHCAIETFKVDGEAYTHISDHYASLVIMELFGKEETQEDKAVEVHKSARRVMTAEFAE